MAVSIEDLVRGGKYVNAVAGIFFWLFGVAGSLAILIIFSSKRQLRRTASSQYILVAAIFDLVFLGIALGYRIMTDGLSIQGDFALFFYNTAICRIRNYITGLANFGTLYTKCLCTFDQWAATDRSADIRRFSSIKWARIFLTVNTLVWVFMNIPQLIYNDIIKSSSGALSCVNTSKGYIYAYSYFLLPVIYFFVPFIFLIVFGYLTCTHVKQLNQGSLNQGRFRRIERQLTSLIIAQTLVCIITSVPYGAQYLYTGITLTQSKDPYRLAIEALIQHVVRLNLYASSAAPFYVYICLSSEIRRMAIHLVLCRLHKINEVVPSQTFDKTANRMMTEHHTTRTIHQIKNN
ncbi:unnamed protein product [Rotaria sp. Silwood1]|nr:unnamed protein product [Rotaria sp. Silwood1]CAF4762221.1 unnamed protein product [Rotaria sp. Silwood1]